MSSEDEALVLMRGFVASSGNGFSGRFGRHPKEFGSHSRHLGYVPSPEQSRMPPCLRRYSSLKSIVTSNDDLRSCRFRFRKRPRASSSVLDASGYGTSLRSTMSRPSL